VTAGEVQLDSHPIGFPVQWLVRGHASGPVVALDEPLSFWGGFDAATGAIIDQHHPQVGQILSGQVVVMQGGRGSSSASSVIAEAIRVGTAPAAIVMEQADEIVALGAIVADELYGLRMPIVVVDRQTFVSCSAASTMKFSSDED